MMDTLSLSPSGKNETSASVGGKILKKRKRSKAAAAGFEMVGQGASHASCTEQATGWSNMGIWKREGVAAAAKHDDEEAGKKKRSALQYITVQRTKTAEERADQWIRCYACIHRDGTIERKRRPS